MLIGLILGLAALVLRIASFALLVYCVMSFVAPQNDLYRKAAYYVERFLYPIRMKLWSWFPALRSMPVDFSPLALWLLIDVALAIVNMLGRVF